MATKVSEDVSEVWIEYKKDQANQELRNRLMERYLPLVRYNAALNVSAVVTARIGAVPKL